VAVLLEAQASNLRDEEAAKLVPQVQLNQVPIQKRKAKDTPAKAPLQSAAST